ncbi:undecaprenyl-phosphate glucose phosphotransferase [Bradyrhizobium genosp. P]|uniref:undecaprenyl-phosphate glucose phosphotransferase n=1 Tax=Bradyrhizobium genosp. P TaxID=83641 RepID=UPI003CFB3732
MSIGSEIGERASPIRSSAPKEARFSGASIPYLLSTADAFVILVSSVVGGVSYQLAIGNPMPDLVPYCAVGLLASFVHVLRLSGTGYYDFPDCARPHVESTKILVCWFTTGLLLAFFAFLLKVGVDYSRGAFIALFLVAPAGLLATRKITKVVLQNALTRGMVGRTDVLLIGENHELAALEARDLLAFFGSTDVTQFMLSEEGDAARRTATDLQLFQSVSNFVQQHDCKEILLALNWTDGERMEFVRNQIKKLPVAAKLLPDIRVRGLTHYASSARRRVLAIEIQRAPLDRAERLVKRSMDLVLAGLALCPLLPVMVITAIAIRLDSPGPVIFRQHRKGFNGKQFVMLKFRTMTVQENGPQVTQVVRNDPRVTPVGRLLRSASLDELPQLINVLRGDMSLIGPRPHALAHDHYFEEIIGDYAFRHHVRPGITGWAQCNGLRGATPGVEDIAERVRLDLWYINNWSLWLDIQILIKTIFEVLRKRNAY